MNARAAPARFDPTDKHRRAMIAKVHVAKKELRLTDDDYAAILLEATGHTSSAKCSQAELEKVIRVFQSKGFTAKARPKGFGPAAKPADNPSARKARAMWISLGLLGAIDDPSERALESFARRQLHCDRLQWANQTLTFKLIEALKAMAERHGWSQSTEGLRKVTVPTVLKRRLCEALLAKLRAADMVPADWDVQRTAYEFAGLRIQFLFVGDETLDLVARSFGKVLAGARP